MSVTLTYDDELARVRISATGLGTVDYATVERSTDGVRWTTVRGGGHLGVTAGALTSTLDDYEFKAGVANTYRIRGISNAASSNVGVGAASTGNNTSLTPALPAGIVEGDLLLLLASIRNSGTGQATTPTGWTFLRASGCMGLFGKRYVTGDSAPTVNFAGGVANADTIAQIYARRNAELVPVSTNAQLNGSAQNINYPAMNITTDGCFVIIAGWKQDDWTSVATLAGATEIGETSTTTGDDAGMVWDRIEQTTAANISAGSFAVTGGASAISRALMAAFRKADYVTQQTASITPNMTRVWLKSIAHPFLNRPVTVVAWSPIERPSRSSAFEVIGRSYPVAVTELRGSRRWTLDIYTATRSDAVNMDYVLAAGDVMFVHTPPDCEIPSGYVLINDSNERRPSLRGSSRVFSLPMTEVVQPAADVVGATATWQSIIATYGTWQDVLNAHPTWQSLLDLIANPSTVIVP